MNAYPGPVAQVGDVPQPGGRGAATPSASAMSCPWAQVSISRAVATTGRPSPPVPSDLDTGRYGGEVFPDLSPAGPPAFQHRRRLVQVLAPPSTDTVQFGHRPVEVLGERVRVGHGQVGRGVGPGQVTDLVRDRPAGGRCRGGPARPGQVGDALVADLPGRAGPRPTPAAGWTIAHQVGHLAWTDAAAHLAITDPDAFTAT